MRPFARALLVLPVLSLVVAHGCGDSGDTGGGGGGGAGGGSGGGAGGGGGSEDGGVHYEPTAPTCTGTAVACSARSAAACNAGAGCVRGVCEGDPQGSCDYYDEDACKEDGCTWVWDIQYCSDPTIILGCSTYDHDRCEDRAGCSWDEAGTDCSGSATRCEALAGATCAEQPGCALECESDRDLCDGDCVDLQVDSSHCGSCGNGCGAGTCDGGECRCPDGSLEDACGECDDADCEQDCAGTWGGSATEDMCGTCDADPSNDCEADCAGTWGGSATEDMCGTCDSDPSNDCAQDCEGAWGGVATEDRCGVCDADPSNDCDCNLVPGGPADEDMCGTCDTDPSNDCVEDCSGTWGGAAVEDMCGTCDASSANDCVPDCAGTWGGTAAVDDCGTCDDDPIDDCIPGGCGGVTAYGTCWYLSEAGQSCSDACGGYAFYDSATNTVAGSDGTNAACTYVMNALGISGTAYTSVFTTFIGGCMTSAYYDAPTRYAYEDTSASGTQPGYRRACACTH